MISSKKSHQYHLEADRIALNKKKLKKFSARYWISLISPDYIWRFQKTLRAYEYYLNNKKTLFDKVRVWIVYKKYQKLALKLGFSIPPNVFGPGLSIAHYGSVVVSKHARIGANCRIHVGVNIGTQAGYEDRAPVIGNNVYIGPGAKIFGAITIADNVAIGANAVVTKTIEQSNVVVAGVPAKVIGQIDTSKILIRATEVLGTYNQD